MWLTILHKLFGSKENLSREELDNYLDDQLDNKGENLVEQKLNASEFDNRAMEGFKDSNLRSRDMNRLDSKFNPQPNGISTTIIISLITTSAALIILFVYFKQLQNNEIYAKLTKNDIVSVQEDKVNTHQDPINLEVDSNNNISAEELVRSPKHTAIIQSEDEVNDYIERDDHLSDLEQMSVKEQMPSLALKTVPAVSENHSKALPSRHYGKEIYLSNLKLIDFRGDRLSPLITKYRAESGTQADQENQNRKKELVNFSEESISYHEYLSITAEMIHKKDYASSVERLEHILSIYPTDENALFYSGLCYFNLGQYHLAIERWRDCIGSFRQNFYEESLWYSLKAYKALENQKKVIELAKRIYEEKGFYAKDAFEILNKQ